MSCNINYKQRIIEDIQEQLDFGASENFINNRYLSHIYGKVISNGEINIPDSLIKYYEGKEVNTPISNNTITFDSNFSPLQLSDSLKPIYKKYQQQTDYNDLETQRLFLEEVDDLQFDKVYTNKLGQDVGLYSRKGEIPNYSRFGNTFQEAFNMLLRDKDVVEGDMFIQPTNTFYNTLSDTQKEAYNYLLDYLKQINPDFKVEVSNINDLAIVDLNKGIITLSNEASFEDFTEEVFHILVELLPKELINPLMSEIQYSKVYSEVYEIYKDDPEFKIGNEVNIEKIKKETLVKMINEYSKGTDISKLSKHKQVQFRSMLDKILDFFKEIFKFTDLNNLENLTQAILNKDIKFENNVELNGIYKSKKVLTDYTIKGLGFSLLDTSVKEYYLTWKDIFEIEADGSIKKKPLYDELLNMGKKLAEVNSGIDSKVFIQTYNMPNELQSELDDLDFPYLRIGEYPILLETNAVSQRVLGIDINTQAPLQVIIPFRVDGRTQYREKTVIVKKLSSYLFFEYLDTDENGEEIKVDLRQVYPESVTYYMINQVAPYEIKVEDVKVKNNVTQEIRDYFTDLLTKSQTDDSTNEYLDGFIKAVRELDRNIEMVEKSGINEYYNKIQDKLNITKSLATQLSKVQNTADFIEKIDLFFSYMENMQQVMDRLNEIFKSNDLDTLFADQPLVKLNQIYRLVHTWSSIAEGMETQMVDLNKKGYANFSAKLAVFTQSIKLVQKNLFNTIEGTIATQIANTIESDFNSSLRKNRENLLNELEQRYSKLEGEEKERAIRLGTARLLELENQIKAQSIQRKDIIDILKGKKGDLKDVGGLIKGLFDSYAVGARYANDPIIATFAKMIDSVNFEASIETNDTISKYLELSELINQLGGEIEAGKRLTQDITTYEYVDVRVDGKIFKVKQENSQKTFLNPYGDYMNWDLSNIFSITDYPETKSLNDLYALRHNVEQALIYGTNEYIPNASISLKKEIDDAIKKIREKVFYRKYAEPFYTVKEDAINNYPDNDKVKLSNLVEVAEEEIKAMYNEIAGLRPLMINADYKDFIDLRLQISNLYRRISKLQNPAEFNSGTDEFITASILKTIKDNRKLFRNNIDNLEDFIGDLLTVVKPLSIAGEIEDLVFDLTGSIKDNVKELLGEYLLKNTNTSSFGLDQPNEEIQKVIEFLDDSISFNPSESFYNERDRYIREISGAIARLNILDYVSEYDGRNVIQMNITGLSTEDINLVSLLNGKSFNTVVEGREWAKTNGEEYFVYSTQVTLKTGEIKPVKFLMNKKGNYVKLTKGNSRNKDISEKWEDIFEITKKYKDSNGFSYRLTKEDQAAVTKLETEIEELKEQALNSSNRTIKVDYKLYQERLQDRLEKLKKLQLNFYTEEYYIELKEKLRGSANSYEEGAGISFFTPQVSELVKLSRLNDNKLFLQTYSIFLGQVRGSYDTVFRQLFDNGKVITLEEAKQIDDVLLFPGKQIPIKALTQADLNFFEWFYNNHVLRNDGTLEPSYHHRKYVPSNTLDLDVKLSYKYIDNSIQDKYLSENFYEGKVDSRGVPIRVKNTKGQYMPKDFTIDAATNDELIQGYIKLSNEEKKLHKSWVEDEHIKRQLDARKAYSIEKKGYLDYTVPFKEKENVETTFMEKIKQMWDELRGRIKSFENNIADDNDEAPWKNTKTKFLDFWSTYISRTQSVKPESLYKDRSRKIPIIYTKRMNSSEVSNNIFASTTEYISNLNRAKFIHGKMPEINSIKNTLEFNKPFNNRSGDYMRHKRIEAYLENNIYRKGLPSNHFAFQILRGVRAVLIAKSQLITNPVGFTKNIVAGLIANYIHSGNVNASFKLNKTRSDFSTTAEALAFASKVTKERHKLTNEESFEYFISRTLNPQAKEIHELMKSNNATKNYFYGGKFISAGITEGEKLVSYQLMLDITNRIELYENVDGEFKPISFKDSFQFKDGKWGLKEVYKDSEGTKLFEMKDLVEVRRLIDLARFSSIGHSKSDTATMFNNSLVGNLTFFMSYIVPLFQQSFTTNRNDFIGNRVVQNHHLSMLNVMYNTFKYIRQKENYWNFMSSNEKRDFLRGVTSYLYGFALYLIMRLLFGFDPEDEKDVKEVKNQSNFENFALLTTVRVLSELESGGLISWTPGKYPVPLISNNLQSLSQPMVFKEFFSSLGIIMDGISLEQYKKGDSRRGYEEGDYKFPVEVLEKFNLRSEKYDFGLMLQDFINMQKRG